MNVKNRVFRPWGLYKVTENWDENDSFGESPFISLAEF